MKLKFIPEFFKMNEARLTIILVLITLLLRSMFLFYIYEKRGTSNWSDDWYYLSMGEQIAQGNWEPQSQGRPQMIVGPVIPLIIALFIKLFSDPAIPFFVYNIVVTSALIIVLFYLGKELFDIRIGLILALWGLLFTDHYKYLPHLLKEPTLYFLVPLTAYLLIKSIRLNFSFRWLMFTAVSFAFLIHTDERFFAWFPLFILMFLSVRPLSKQRFLKPALTFTGLVLILMLPWGIRNYIVFEQIVILTPRTTVFTSKLWGKNLEAATSHFSDDEIRKKVNEARYEDAVIFGKNYGITPAEQETVEARVKAFINFWQPTYFYPTFIQYGYRPQKWSLAHNLSGLIFYGIFLPFYLIGILLLWKRRNLRALFIASIPVLHSLLHAYMVWPLERYRSPVNFIIAMVGIWTALELIHYLRKGTWNTMPSMELLS